MPTENRSSNTEMVSVPRKTLENVLRDGSCKREIHAAFLKAQQSIRTLLDPQPPQPHPEPIAWLVGTAFWWTKEEAERDAKATGKAIVPFGPLTGSADVEQLREVIKHSDAQIMRQSMRISNQRALLAEQEALLRELIQIAEDREQGYADRQHGGVINGKAADSLVMLIGRMKLALSPEAAPSAQVMAEVEQ